MNYFIFQIRRFAYSHASSINDQNYLIKLFTAARPKARAICPCPVANHTSACMTRSTRRKAGRRAWGTACPRHVALYVHGTKTGCTLHSPILGSPCAHPAIATRSHMQKVYKEQPRSARETSYPIPGTRQF